MLFSPRALGLAAGLCAATGLAGGGIGYAQATGYFKKDTRPTLYQPLGLLDGRDATAWCSASADPLNEQLSFGFNGPVTIEELRLTTGNNFDASTFAAFARGKKLKLQSGKQSQVINLEDQRGPQTVAVNPPLTGARFTLEILDIYPADDPDASVCLTDVVFVAGGKPLNGAWLTTKLKYDKHVAGVMGTWYAGYEGTPDQFLAFNFDGSFRYSYEPFERRAKEKVLEGTYDVSASRLVFDVKGKRHTAKYSRDAAKRGGFTLAFDGDVPEELKGVFRSMP